MNPVSCILLIIFYSALIIPSIGQNVDVTNENVRVYLRSVSYYFNENLASSITIYDTYYHKIDSIAVPQEGLYVNLPKKDLIFTIKTNDARHRKTKKVFYAEELKDSLIILVDTRKIGIHINIRDVLFEENSFELDSAALNKLYIIKKQLLVIDDSSHCLIIQVHSHIDDLEKENGLELLTNRAAAVVNVLSLNNYMKFRMYDTEEMYRYIENPKSKEEHARNRCVGFKIDNRNCYKKDLIIKE